MKMKKNSKRCNSNSSIMLYAGEGCNMGSGTGGNCVTGSGTGGGCVGNNCSTKYVYVK